MKCYYAVGDKPWVKGFLNSYGDGHRVVLAPAAGSGELVLLNAEILFHDKGISLTGYCLVSQTENAYRLVGVEVRFLLSSKRAS